MNVMETINTLYKQASIPYIGVSNGDPRIYPQYTDIYWDEASDSYRDYDGNEISADDVDEPSPVSVTDILTPEQIAAYRRTQGHDQGVGSALILGTYGGAIAGGIGGNVLGKKLGTSIANKAEAIGNPVGRLGIKALGKAPRIPLIGAGVLGGALLGSVPGIVHGVNHAKKNERATVDKSLSTDQIRLLNERSNLTYKSAMNATETINYFIKTAGVGWDLHGYKQEDLDRIKTDEEVIGDVDDADDEARKYVNRKLKMSQPSYREMYPEKPSATKPKMEHADGVLGPLTLPIAGAALGTIPGTFVENPKMMGIGAAIGAGAGLIGAGIEEGKHFLQHRKDVAQYRDDVATYDDRKKNSIEAIERNNKYNQAVTDYLHTKYTPEQVDMIWDGVWDAKRNARIKTPYDNDTNYKLNGNLFWDNPDNGVDIEDYLTDEVYDDTPSVRNLSQEEMDQFLDKYQNTAQRAREEGWYHDDSYFEPGVKAFLEKAKYLKEQGADTYRLEYE